LAGCDRLADRRDPHYAPVNAYTWRRGRPAALIHPRDRRCLGTLHDVAFLLGVGYPAVLVGWEASEA